MRRRMQKELRQDEDDNAGIDAADAGMEAAESASQTFREVHRSVRMKPYRDAEKAERKLEKANIEYFQKKAEIENPTSNPFSKWRQKQEIKRQYAAVKAGHTVCYYLIMSAIRILFHGLTPIISGIHLTFSPLE